MDFGVCNVSLAFRLVSIGSRWVGYNTVVIYACLQVIVLVLSI